MPNAATTSTASGGLLDPTKWDNGAPADPNGVPNPITPLDVHIASGHAMTNPTGKDIMFNGFFVQANTGSTVDMNGKSLTIEDPAIIAANITNVSTLAIQLSAISETTIAAGLTIGSTLVSLSANDIDSVFTSLTALGAMLVNGGTAMKLGGNLACSSLTVGQTTTISGKDGGGTATRTLAVSGVLTITDGTLDKFTGISFGSLTIGAAGSITNSTIAFGATTTTNNGTLNGTTNTFTNGTATNIGGALTSCTFPSSGMTFTNTTLTSVVAAGTVTLSGTTSGTLTGATTVAFDSSTATSTAITATTVNVSGSRTVNCALTVTGSLVFAGTAHVVVGKTTAATTVTLNGDSYCLGPITGNVVWNSTDQAHGLGTITGNLDLYAPLAPLPTVSGTVTSHLASVTFTDEEVPDDFTITGTVTFKGTAHMASGKTCTATTINWQSTSAAGGQILNCTTLNITGSVAWNAGTSFSASTVNIGNSAIALTGTINWSGVTVTASGAVITGGTLTHFAVTGDVIVSNGVVGTTVSASTMLTLVGTSHATAAITSNVTFLGASYTAAAVTGNVIWNSTHAAGTFDTGITGNLYVWSTMTTMPTVSGTAFVCVNGVTCGNVSAQVPQPSGGMWF